MSTIPKTQGYGAEKPYEERKTEDEIYVLCFVVAHFENLFPSSLNAVVGVAINV